MTQPVCLSVSAALLFVSTCTVSALELSVTTGELARDYAWTPLHFELRGLQDLPGVIVTDAASGETVPSQMSIGDAFVRVHWMAHSLEKGRSYTWKLELLKKKGEPKKPRVEIADIARGQVGVRVDGRELTRYVYGGGVAGQADYKPYFYPIASPASDHSITRHYPMKKGVEGEKSDHPHHRSLWLTHEGLNGLNFWHEKPGDETGYIVHQSFEAQEGGTVFGQLDSTNSWQSSKGDEVVTERRQVRIWPLDENQALFDFHFALVAKNGPVEFGATKEGTFGIRVAGTLKEKSGGLMRNSRGGKGAGQCWGKPAEWVDYSGRVGGKQVGITIFDHPSSFRHPTHWHVRDYGLFAANPFGYNHFYKNDKTPEGRKKAGEGQYTLEKGRALELVYRVYIHRGDTDSARVAQVWEGFAHPPKLKPVK